MTPSADWMTGVPCKEAPELFFSYTLANQERAAGICLTECSALTECRAWALHHGDIDGDGRAVHGVIAGALPRMDSGRRPRPSMRACGLASCGRLFMGHANRKYCSEECKLASKRQSRLAS